MELRDLERLYIQLNPEQVLMEGDTVLVQYIITSYSFDMKDEGIICHTDNILVFLVVDNPDNGIRLNIVM